MTLSLPKTNFTFFIIIIIFHHVQEVTATSRHYVDRLFDPDPQKVLQGVM